MNLTRRRILLTPRSNDMIGNLFASMERDMLNLFDGRSPFLPAPRSTFGYDLKHTEKTSIITIALPGTEKKNIHVNTREDGDDHTVEVWISNEKDEKKKGSEISFILSENHDHENVEAEYSNGLLTITIPKVVRVNTKVGKIEEIKIN